MHFRNKLKDFTVKEKLKTYRMCMVTIMFIMGVVSIVLSFLMNSNVHEITEVWSPSLSCVQVLNTLTSDYRMKQYGHLVATDESSMAAFETELQRLEEEIQETSDSFQELISTEKEKADFKNIQTEWAEYKQQSQELLELSRAGKVEEGGLLMVGDLLDTYNIFLQSFENLETYENEELQKAKDAVSFMFIVMIVVMIVIVVIAVSMATTIAKMIGNMIVEPIAQITAVITSMQEGDFSKTDLLTYESEDELGDVIKAVEAITKKLAILFEDLIRLLDEMASGNFSIRTNCEEEYIGGYQPLLMSIRKMNRQMTQALKDVQSASEMVSVGASNLAEASQAMAEGATDQAASTQQMQATMETITGGLSTTVKEVNASYEEAVRVSGRAEVSQEEMKIMTEAMKKISDTSLKIGTVIGEIEDIASQTNLLSLNASIEAARAGEAGRGFAVVADQIRALAEQSAAAAVNTKELIEASIREVHVGNEAVTRTAAVLGEVVEAIQNIAKTSKGLSDTTESLASSMQQADKAMARIAEVVESNSATAEESSATSEELSAQASNMDALVGKFQLEG